MAAPLFLSVATLARLRKLHSNGERPTVIARMLGLSRGAVLRRLFPDRYTLFDAEWRAKRRRMSKEAARGS